MEFEIDGIMRLKDKYHTPVEFRLRKIDTGSGWSVCMIVHVNGRDFEIARYKSHTEELSDGLMQEIAEDMGLWQ